MPDDESDFWRWCQRMGPPFGPDAPHLNESQEEAYARAVAEAQDPDTPTVMVVE